MVGVIFTAIGVLTQIPIFLAPGIFLLVVGTIWGLAVASEDKKKPPSGPSQTSRLP